jgi:hypothetical protein
VSLQEDLSEFCLALGDIWELDRPRNHHTACVVGGTGEVVFQGSLNTSDWYTLARAPLEQGVAWLGTPLPSGNVPNVFCYLRVIGEGVIAGSPVVYIASA